MRKHNKNYGKGQIRSDNKRLHTCPACDKQEVIYDIVAHKFYCKNCDKTFKKEELKD